MSRTIPTDVAPAIIGTILPTASTPGFYCGADWYITAGKGTGGPAVPTTHPHRAGSLSTGRRRSQVARGHMNRKGVPRCHSLLPAPEPR